MDRGTTMSREDELREKLKTLDTLAFAVSSDELSAEYGIGKTILSKAYDEIHKEIRRSGKHRRR